MIATMVLEDAFDARVPLPPFLGDEATATVGGGFFKTGRFRGHELAENREHLRQARFQKAQKFFGRVWFRHGEDMLATLSKQSNPAKSRKASENGRGVKAAATAEERISRGAGFAYN